MPSGVRSRLAHTVRFRSRRLIPRTVHAAWHHAAALLREFRIPIFGFVFLTLVGGFVYGELYEAITGGHAPLINRPYVIVQLMVLEAPETVPPEAALAAFWYFMPVAFVFLVGLGAADFVGLVFNRDENRNLWSEALALAYRNHGIVFGAGHVGQRVIQDLVAMGLDVVAIDNVHKPNVEKFLGELGVPVVRGDGRDAATLVKARLVLSSADLAAPVFAGAAMGVEITQKMQIKGEEYSTIHLPVEAGSFFVGRTVGDLQEDHELDGERSTRAGHHSAGRRRPRVVRSSGPGDGGGFPEHDRDQKVRTSSPCGIPGVKAFMVA